MEREREGKKERKKERKKEGSRGGGSEPVAPATVARATVAGASSPDPAAAEGPRPGGRGGLSARRLRHIIAADILRRVESN